MTSGFFIFAQQNVGTRLTSTNYIFNEVTFWGYSGFATGVPVSNVNPVYIGVETGKMPIKVPAGSSYTITLDDKEAVDNLANYYAAGQTGDGICFYAW